MRIRRIFNVIRGVFTSPQPPPWYKAVKNADHLLQAADSVLEQVDQARADAIAQGQTGPVYLVFGECHYSHDHMAIKILVLDALRRRELKTLVGIEMPHNYLDMYNDVPTQPVARRADGLVHDDDYTKAALARIYLKQDLEGATARVEGMEHAANMLHKYVWRYMTEGALSARFIDASSLNGDELIASGFEQRLAGVSLADPLSQRIAKAQGIYNTFNIRARTVPETLALRDAFMVEAVNQHVQDKAGADVYVLSCGAQHVFGKYTHRKGEQTGASMYTGGLSAALQKQGGIVVPVFMDMAHQRPKKIIEKSGIDASGMPDAQRLFFVSRPTHETIMASRALAAAGIHIDAPYGSTSLFSAMRQAYEAYVKPALLSLKPEGIGR